MIYFKQKGDFFNIFRFLKKNQRIDIGAILDRYGGVGVNALATQTPKDTGQTASSWNYTIDVSATNASIVWYNSNTPAGFSVALSLQYGHGTGWGGYVQGVDYINPAMRPIFDQILNDVWEEVINA